MSGPDRPPSFSRRSLLGKAGLGGAGLVATATTGARGASGTPDPAITDIQDWNRYLGDGVDKAPYGKPSKHEAHVIRRNVSWFTADTASSINFTPLHALEGVVTPNGLCFERHHSGVADIDPAKHRLMVHGLVEKPLVFALDDLKRFPGRVNRLYFLECSANSGMEWRGAQMNGCQYTHGMIHNVWYTGIPLRSLLAEAGLRPGARWLLAEGADAAAMTRSIPLEKALKDCIVAWAMNGEALRPEQGYPLRIVVPGWEGSLWVKWLRRIKVGDQPWQHREETSKYTDLMADGRSRRFTWVMDAKSVITSPSPQAPFRHRGANVLTGLAWSGRGRITRVDVSIDGGRNWTTARLDGPVLPMSLTRFYLDFDWDGREMLVQSRAMDETGYLQPNKADLRKIRGINSAYHNNAIQTWRVMPGGETENVEVS